MPANVTFAVTILQAAGDGPLMPEGPAHAVNSLVPGGDTESSSPPQKEAQRSEGRRGPVCSAPKLPPGHWASPSLGPGRHLPESRLVSCLITRSPL